MQKYVLPVVLTIIAILLGLAFTFMRRKEGMTEDKSTKDAKTPKDGEKEPEAAEAGDLDMGLKPAEIKQVSCTITKDKKLDCYACNFPQSEYTCKDGKIEPPKGGKCVAVPVPKESMKDIETLISGSSGVQPSEPEPKSKST